MCLSKDDNGYWQPDKGRVEIKGCRFEKQMCNILSVILRQSCPKSLKNVDDFYVPMYTCIKPRSMSFTEGILNTKNINLVKFFVVQPPPGKYTY